MLFSFPHLSLLCLDLKENNIERKESEDTFFIRKIKCFKKKSNLYMIYLLLCPCTKIIILITNLLLFLLMEFFYQVFIDELNKNIKLN